MGAEEGLGTGFLPAGLRGARGRPSSPRRGKPFRSGETQTAREHTYISNPSIKNGLSVDKQEKSLHPSTGHGLWMDAQLKKDGLSTKSGL